MSIDFAERVVVYKFNGNSHSWTFGVLNPINRLRWWVKDLKWKHTVKFLADNNLGSVVCQGCGEGIATYRIEDPNYKSGSGKHYNTCDNCTSFYDQHWTARKIDGWRWVLKKW